MGGGDKPSFKIYCKLDPKFVLTSRNETIVLAPFVPCDEKQQWFKDTSSGIKINDKECFSLINKATGKAVKSAPPSVTLAPKAENDYSLLWFESQDSGNGYKSIQMFGGNLCFDAQHGKAFDGTKLILFKWGNGNNQLWKMEKHESPKPTTPALDLKHEFRIMCSEGTDLSLTIKDGKVVLARANPKDDLQRWYKDHRYGSQVKDMYKNPGFILVNKVTRQVIKKPNASNEGLKLATYHPDVLDKNVLWGKNANGDYTALRSVIGDNTKVEQIFSAKDGKIKDGVEVVTTQWRGRDQLWRIAPIN